MATQSIQREMMSRRRELIDLQKRQGGCVGIQLKTDNLLFCYDPARKTSLSNPLGEKFYCRDNERLPGFHE